MRHRVAGSKLSRNGPHRKAMFRNMAIALFTHEQITTTVPKAKAVKPFVEKLITLARKGDLAARRLAASRLTDHVMVKHDEDEAVERNKYGEVVGGPKVIAKLFDEIGPRYAERNGGYTRIVRLGKHRIGDGGDLCVLQLVGDEEGPQVSGRYSRRRQIANRRSEKAAELRRKLAGGDSDAASTATAADAADEEVKAEVDDAAVESADTEKPAEGDDAKA